MSESKVQAKILKWLKANGYWVFKTILCNRNGIPDIVGCTPSGRFFAIEVKGPGGRASKLQEYNVKEIKKLNGIACIAFDLETVIEALKE